MLVNILVLVPFVIALIILFLPKQILRVTSLLGSTFLIGLVAFIIKVYNENTDSPLLMAKSMWIESMNSFWLLSLDSMSIIMALLTSIVSLIIFLSIKEEQYNNKFFSLVWFMLGAMLGVFTAKDGLLFYVFWELALIPIYFICLVWGGENRSKITFKFFIYTLTGSLFMLGALIFLYLKSGSWDIASLYEAGATLSSEEQNYIFWALFLGFGIKMPVFPFHTWQPDTYYTAPTHGTMLLSGIMLKMGTYGVIRWLLPVVPTGVANNANIVIILSIIGIVFASVIAMTQKDFKRLLAWSSIAHVGLISAGIFTLNPEALKGAYVQMIAHGINVVGLFYIAEIIYSRTQTYDINKLGGIRSVSPIFSVLFLIVLLGSIALPLTNGFIGEFLLLNGIFQYNFWYAFFGGLTVIFGAVYMLRAYQGIMLGEVNEITRNFVELTSREKITLVFVTILVFIFGLFPNIVLNLANIGVDALINNNLGVKEII
jgi:NADH-quinone oxidoreductase subunit M